MSKQNTQMSSGIAKDGPSGKEAAEADDVRENISKQMNDKDDAADIALAAVDELADQAAELDEIRKEFDVTKQQLDETKEQLLRKVAEFQNYRRRTEQEKTALVELGKSIAVQQFLDVLDDFERSIEAAEQVRQQDDETSPAYAALKDGVDLVYKKFMDELAKQGVEPIESVGQPFDEHMHEAMMQQPSEEYAPGTVVQELQKGYRMDDRILRHAKVIVAA